MNENLLKTSIVKSSVKRYLKEKLSYKEIMFKLKDIHLIVIDEETLKSYIKGEKLYEK